MDSPLTVARAVVDEPHPLDSDVACRKCGYNLRGLLETGRCPECATPVGLSVKGDLLRYADPDWVRKVARGLTILLWMLPIGILVGIVAAVVSMGSAAVASLVGFLVSLVSFWGVWLMTEPDPSRVGEDVTVSPRRVIRICVVVGLAAQPLQVGLEMEAFSTLARRALFSLWVAAALIGLVGEFAKFAYYERLARRIPDDRMARRARFLRWAFTATLLVLTIGGGVTAAVLPPGAAIGGPAVALACGFSLAGLVFLVFALLSVQLLLRLRRALIQQATLARATWAAATQPAAAPA